MRTFLLLLLPLMAGCKDAAHVTGCRGGWAEFICKYPERDETYAKVAVVKNRKTLIESTMKNVWENNADKYFIYHSTTDKNARVAVRALTGQDSGKYECQFESDSSEEKEKEEVELKVDKNECQEAFTQTAYRTATTSLSCGYQGNSRVSTFFCKDHGSVCEDILSTPSSQRSIMGTFTLSISNVSSQHAGVYWCGLEADGGRYRAALRKIHLKVEATITNFTRSPAVGQSLTYWCQYSTKTQLDKFICKGEDPSICEPLVTTKQLNHSTGRFSMKDDTEKRKITITVRDVRSEDTGTYWCGAQTSDPTRSNPFFHRLTMTVVPPAPPSMTSSASPHPATPSVSSTHSTTGSAGSAAGETGEPWGTIVIVVVVCVALLVLLLILVLSYKRHQRSRNTRPGKLQNEDRAYEEIKERPQKPGDGTALQTIYVTAGAPTMPSAPQYYSTINYHSSSGEAGGDTCATVNDQCPAYSTVNHPSRLPEDPFYSTATNPQQH